MDKIAKKKNSQPFRQSRDAEKVANQTSRSTLDQRTEETKVPVKTQKEWLKQTEEQKHANSHQVEEEKKMTETASNGTMNQNMLSRYTSDSNSYGPASTNNANPQCGYNQPYKDIREAQFAHNFYSQEQQQFLYEKYLYQTLSKEIDEETEQITIMVNMIQKYRQDIKKELEKVAVATFSSCHSNVEAHIYGSVATELALPESDMDIMITGVNSFGNKEAHLANISLLFEGIQGSFSEKILVKSCPILHTQVPIIKLKFNLSEYYDECVKAGRNVLPYVNFESIDSINPNLRVLSVDISISDSFDESAHLGLLQSNFVRDKLNLYPVLRPVCLMLKKLLVKYNFNDPYTGGLGSFSLFIMLYAALCFEQMNSHELFQCESTYKARLLAWFLSMYGESFDIERKVIFFLEDGMPMLFDKLGKSPSGNNKILCVYDPTNSKNNTTQKAFRIEEIQQLFRATKQSITKEFAKVYNKGVLHPKILFP